jgi:hypothetical protein
MPLPHGAGLWNVSGCHKFGITDWPSWIGRSANGMRNWNVELKLSRKWYRFF